MSASIETMECFPKPITLGPWEMPAPEADHARCQGGQTTPGVLGGWRCPCPCHHLKPAASHPSPSSPCIPNTTGDGNG